MQLNQHTLRRRQLGRHIDRTRRAEQTLSNEKQQSHAERHKLQALVDATVRKMEETIFSTQLRYDSASGAL